jgi:hypothetical protein
MARRAEFALSCRKSRRTEQFSLQTFQDSKLHHILGTIDTAYPSESYFPTGPEASQAFTFLVREQRLDANVSEYVYRTFLEVKEY